MNTHIENDDYDDIKTVTTKTLTHVLNSLDENNGGRISHLIGWYGHVSRFHIYNCFDTESSSRIREPSRAWPYSKLKHSSTIKYHKQLAEMIREELKSRK
ncbi:hypothetical protein [Vreelandella titanicae]|uniref:Uncharacterized protein n=1 Tax=Vreelandella titanicae TaxID=664683 RepID=A0AAP9NMS1_9GAMM|nr:hypothetical protein [Halomonas titanicae]QKS24626.1 hypothetical protein FX987_02408 [Halomonas titanicae]